MADLNLEFDEACEAVLLEFERSDAVDSLATAAELIQQVEPARRPDVMTELARIDLERRFAPDVAATPSRFIDAFPDFFCLESARREIAFEHYRLARRNGIDATRESIGRLYSVSASFAELPLGETERRCDGTSSRVLFPRPGDVFCGYPLLAELGRGALARVYLARQPDLAERLVVLKISTRLTAEPDRLAKLQHTNIVPIYSVHQQGGLYGICMPYMGALTVSDLLLSRRNPLNKPQSLQQLITTVLDRRVSTIVHSCEEIEGSDRDRASNATAAQHRDDSPDTARAELERIESLLGFNELAESLGHCMGSMDDVSAALCIVEGLCEGMAFAHARGIVHGDLKPENVLLANDGRPVILDFNLAGDVNAPKLHWVGGTLPYMSPEHMRAMKEGRTPTRTDDVFSIGVILYRMIVGKFPFPDLGTTASLEEWIETRDVPAPSPRQFLATVSPGLCSIILKCLGPTSNRYPSAVELLQDLKCHRENRVLQYASDRSPQERAGKFIRRHPVLTTTSFGAAVISALTFIVILLGVISYRKSQQLSAETAATELEHAKHEILAALQAPDRNRDSLSSGVHAATQLLDVWRVKAAAGIDRRSPLYQLDDVRRSRASNDLASLVYALAGAESDQALLDKDAAESHRHAAEMWNDKIAALSPRLKAAADYQRLRIRGTNAQAGGLEKGTLSDVESEDLLARMLRAREDRDTAAWLSAAEQLVDREPSDPTTWFNLGAARFVSGRFEEAAWAFNVSQRLQPESLQSLFWCGLSRLQAKQFTAARADFSSCLAARPDWTAAAYNRALACKAMGDLDAALADVTSLCDRGVGGPRVWFLRSQLRAARGDVEGAALERARGLETKPIDADDYAALGVAKLASSPDEAIGCFEAALAIDPNHLASLQNSSYYYAELKHDPIRAIEFMSRIIDLRPDQATGYASRGILAARSGRVQTATGDAARLETMTLSALERLQLAGIYSLLSGATKTEEGSDDARDRWRSDAIRCLRIALAAEPGLADTAANDPDLREIASEKAFQELVRSARVLAAR
ncbi:MAG: protein kinase [Pirellulales bacterium]